MTFVKSRCQKKKVVKLINMLDLGPKTWKLVRALLALNIKNIMGKRRQPVIRVAPIHTSGTLALALRSTILLYRLLTFLFHYSVVSYLFLDPEK